MRSLLPGSVRVAWHKVKVKNNFETGVKTAIHTHPVTAVAFLRGRVRVSFVVTWFKSDTRRASSAFFLLRNCLKHDKGRSLVTRKFEGVLYTGILTKVQAKVQSSRRKMRFHEIRRQKEEMENCRSIYYVRWQITGEECLPKIDLVVAVYKFVLMRFL